MEACESDPPYTKKIQRGRWDTGIGVVAMEALGAECGTRQRKVGLTTCGCPGEGLGGVGPHEGGLLDCARRVARAGPVILHQGKSAVRPAVHLQRERGGRRLLDVLFDGTQRDDAAGLNAPGEREGEEYNQKDTGTSDTTRAQYIPHSCDTALLVCTLQTVP